MGYRILIIAGLSDACLADYPDNFYFLHSESESDLPVSGIADGSLAFVAEDLKGIWQFTDGFWVKEDLKGDQGDSGPRGTKGNKGDPGDITLCWPIGSVFIAVPDTNPSELLGFGTWVEVEQDKLPAHIWRRTA